MEKGVSWTLDDVRRGHRLQNENTDFSEYPSFRPAPEYQIDGPTTDSHVLIYNRVPKCASSTVQTLLDLLALRNGFKFKSLPLLTPGKAFTEAEERDFVRNATRFGGGAVDGHFYFVDFNKHGSSVKPIWINVVRDPVERAASMFKYLRREERWPRGAERPPKVRGSPSKIFGFFILVYVPFFRVGSRKTSPSASSPEIQSACYHRQSSFQSTK